jgi:hypothetical protein
MGFDATTCHMTLDLALLLRWAPMLLRVSQLQILPPWWGELWCRHVPYDSGLSRRQSLEPWDTWQHRSSPQQGGEVWSRGTRDGAGAHLSKEARSGLIWHVVVPEPTSTDRCNLKLQLTWQCVNAHPTSYLNLELECGVPDLLSINN